MAKSKADKAPVTIYRAWHPGRETEAEGRDWGAIDTACAAKLQAGFFFRHQDGFDASWPIVFRVREPGGTTWDVEVALNLLHDFTPAKPREVG